MGFKSYGPNQMIRDLYAELKDPDKWGGTGKYQPGKKCIVTGISLCPGRGTALSAIRAAIYDRYGDKFKFKARKADIITFNDHPQTTHQDMLHVLIWAELKTRPFWKKPMAK